MELSRFQFIWCMEYAHRMWGRLIGVSFALPAAYFYSKGYFTKPMLKRVGVLGGLIGFQGLLGWFMVRSGLEDKPGVPRVSHFRLSAHLSSAAVIYSLFAWNSFTHLVQHTAVAPFEGAKLLKILGHSTKAVMFTTLIWGAFVAGLDAGLVYNSWPKFADRWIPSDLVVPTFGGMVGNLLQNPTGVQFTHRLLAYTTCALSTTIWLLTLRMGVARTGPEIRRAAHFIFATTVAQTVIGISALLHYVPISLAALHQNTSILLLTSLLWFTHCLKYVPK
ncbi:hypothetical protein Ciccas_011126 [Cichlidogyrus casuarinus]|uniref:Cytochrome c oxidase assembly protein COX15 n=1 Tax=Cichlidogyrus casuarinus TaxID=1844966 RepID=A0ABD2PS68_9PLAT